MSAQAVARRNGNGNGKAALTSATTLPIDLDDLLAAAGEDEALPYPFTFRGHSYEFPHPKSWPIQVQKRLVDQDFEGALKLLLGDGEAQQMFDDGLSMGHVDVLLRNVMKSAGLGDDLGNSSASPPPGSTQT